MKDRGLSPMVATIVLISMIMVIAGILSASIIGTTPEEPRESGIYVEEISPDSKDLTLHMQSGQTYLKAFSLVAESENNEVLTNSFSSDSTYGTDYPVISGSENLENEGECRFDKDNIGPNDNIGWESNQQSIKIIVDDGANPPYKDDGVRVGNGDTVRIDYDTLKVKWEQMELRIAGEKVKGYPEKATSNGKLLSLTHPSENVGFHVGDVLAIKEISPGINDGDEVTLIWNPNDQMIFIKEA